MHKDVGIVAEVGIEDALGVAGGRKAIRTTTPPVQAPLGLEPNVDNNHQQWVPK